MPNSNRTLIKLDDEIIEITQGEKGLEAKKLSEQDMIEVTLLDEGVEKLIENDINKIANEAYTELQDSFKQTLKVNVLKIVGFENRWSTNGWEVDHCNGRSSALTEYMSHKVKSMFTEEFNKLLQPEIEAMLKPLKKEMVKEFKRCFEFDVKQQIRIAASDAAKTFIADTVKLSITKYQRQAIEKAEVAFLGRTARLADEDELND